MADMMNKDEYERQMEMLKTQAFPWTQPFELEPTPGHLPVLREVLQQIEVIVGRENLKGDGTFLYGPRLSGKALFVRFEMRSLGVARVEAIREVLYHYIQVSSKQCPACGSTDQYPGENFCREHVSHRQLFTDDIPEPETAPPEDVPSLPAENVAQGRDTVEPFTKLDADQPAPELPSMPEDSIQLYSPEELSQVLKRLSVQSGGDTSRLRKLYQRIQSGLPYRRLAQLPAAWSAPLDQLQTDFPNFAEFIEFLRDQFTLSEYGDQALQFPPVLFNGKPGVGKTEMALSLAERFGTGYRVIDMASAQIGACLSGSDAYWSNTQPGHLFESLMWGETANPLIVLDELDKVSTDERYRPDGALFSLLEVRTARQFRDLSVQELALDASHVLWVATSNQQDKIESALQSRFTAFQIPEPDREQIRTIAQAIYRNLREGHAWGAQMSPLLPESVTEKLGSQSPRLLRNQLLRACARVLRAKRSELQAEDFVMPVIASRRGIGFVV